MGYLHNTANHLSAVNSQPSTLKDFAKLIEMAISDCYNIACVVGECQNCKNFPNLNELCIEKFCCSKNSEMMVMQLKWSLIDLIMWTMTKQKRKCSLLINIWPQLVSRFPDSLFLDDLKSEICKMLHECDVDIDPVNIKACHCLKSNHWPKKVIEVKVIKLAKTKDASKGYEETKNYRPESDVFSTQYRCFL